jgi:hypothetical protein
MPGQAERNPVRGVCETACDGKVSLFFGYFQMGTYWVGVSGVLVARQFRKVRIYI